MRWAIHKMEAGRREAGRTEAGRREAGRRFRFKAPAVPLSASLRRTRIRPKSLP